MFRPANSPRNVTRVDKPDWIGEAKTGARRAGILFERAQAQEMVERFGSERVEIGPWFSFIDGGKKHFCSPDMILTLPHGPIIIEVKSAHCRRAWEQLNLLYLPVLREFLNGGRFGLVEICKTFYPEVDWPGPMELVGDISHAPRSGTGVHVVNGFLKGR